MRSIRTAVASTLLALAVGCFPYVTRRSAPDGDWSASVPWRSDMSRGAGSFGARACRALRVRLLTHGRASLPPSFAASNWIVARILATPAWADFNAIRDVYREAERLTLLTGVKHNVDHVVPLNHPRVCGLHVHFNLRAIPAGPNMSKGNDWCPEQRGLWDGPAGEQLTLW